MNSQKIDITDELVQKLIASQFPEWAHLPIKPVKRSGWDNRTFHLGKTMLVRLPSAQCYAAKVEKEQFWLPKLAPHLPLPIPTALAMGKPNEDYPFNWSVYAWIPGQQASKQTIFSIFTFAKDLAHFLKTLQKIDTTGGPIAGAHNFYRGGNLAVYDEQTQQALTLLKNRTDITIFEKTWNKALRSTWQNPPVWVHGDIAPGNLLVKDGKLCAVIDFGGLSIGDPACDYAIAWTFLSPQARDIFKEALQVDEATWARARGWALWKALIIYAELPGTDARQIKTSEKILQTIITDFIETT